MASIDERLEKLKKQKEELKAKEKKLLAPVSYTHLTLPLNLY